MVRRKRPRGDDESDDDNQPRQKLKGEDYEEVEQDEDDSYMDGVSLNKMPSYPHPDAGILDEINFENLPENFFMIAYGSRRTGKTHAISCLLESIKDRFDFAYLFSATAGLHEGDKDELDFSMIRPEAKFKGFDEDALRRVIDRQIAVMLHNNKTKAKREQKPNRTLLIFDDFVHEKAVRYSKIFTELPVLGRHYDLSVICLSQGYSAVGSSGLNPATRQNSDFTMTFLPRNVADVERIATWYLAKPKLESMWFTKSVCQEKHACIGIDLTQPHLVEFPDYCYKYIAPKEVPKYELGRVQWRLFHEERRRAKKAALAESIDNDRSFFLERSEIEKRSQIGQGTGLPTNRTRPSLYDLASQL